MLEEGTFEHFNTFCYLMSFSGVVYIFFSFKYCFAAILPLFFNLPIFFSELYFYHLSKNCFERH